MSGIVGVVHFDEEPVDPRLLQQMTNFLAFRGPDAQAVWLDRNVGFGHTLLRTTWEAEHEHQPQSFDGSIWITAHARIDDRANLIERLSGQGRVVTRSTSDVELILHAYHLWGEHCVEQLLGDFAFAIWDGRCGHLFCARDHLGIEPLYYYHSGSTFVFSNTLNCIRLCPGVTSKLNDRAIADFLLFGLNQDLATTTFADIQRLPPAHVAVISKNGVRTKRYWSLPIEEPIFYKKSADYVERFSELLRVAVQDRIRTSWVGIFMSGGLDSSALAATACKLSEKRPSDSVGAFTNVFERLIPDKERYYSGLVASRLGISIRYSVLDGPLLRTPWREFWRSTPEPAFSWLPHSAEVVDFRKLSKHGRVFFYGEGPDNALLYEWFPYLRNLAGRRLWLRMLGEVSKHIVVDRRLDLLSSVVRFLRGRFRFESDRPNFPRWLNKKFTSQFELRNAWDQGRRQITNHPVHPRAYNSFSSPLWENLFTSYTPGVSESPIEVRFPFLDLRVLRYMLSVPVLHWCYGKHLLRVAMRGILPREVLCRPKTPLCGHPLQEALRRRGMQKPTPAQQIGKYVNLAAVNIDVNDNFDDLSVNLRPIVLNYWLQDITGSDFYSRKRCAI